MSEEAIPPFSEWLKFIDEMDKSIPYSNRTISVFFSALAMIIAETDVVSPELKTSEDFLNGLSIRIQSVTDQLAGLSNLEELGRLHSGLCKAVETYQRQILSEDA